VLKNPDKIEEIEDPVVKKAAELVLTKPDITLTEIAKTLGVPLSTVHRRIKNFILRKLREKLKDLSGLKDDDNDDVKVHYSPRVREPDLGPMPTIQKRERIPYTRSEVLRMLDREYGHIVSRVTDHVDWFVEALFKIGWYSTMLAFQYAKVPIEELDDYVRKFGSADEFANYVRRQLVAMIQAASDATKILELEEEVKGLMAKADYLEACLKKAIEQRDNAIMQLRTAIACMCEKCLRRWALAYALQQIPLLELTQMPKPEALKLPEERSEKTEVEHSTPEKEGK